MGLFDLSGKTALVTGGTRGIGLAIALGMQEAGAKVWIHGSGESGTAKVAGEHGFRYVYGDLKDSGAVDKMLEPLEEQEERLNILVNNAGYETHSPVEFGNMEEMDSIYNVNTKSPYFIVKKLIPLLRKSGSGSVINVTSIHQTVPVRGNGYYCMAKAALSMFTKVAALELAKDQIRVNNIAPGAIRTDMGREILASMDFGQWIPLGRVGNSEEIAGPAVFLASAASSYMTGATLYVDGGYSENLLRY